MEVGFTVMIQKQATIVVEEPTVTKSKKGTAGPEFNTERAHCFFYVMGIVHHEFVPPNTMVNSDFYCDILRRLRENVRRKRLALWRSHNWLHHDNAPAHTYLKTTEFVTNNNVVIVPHPPYSPALAPCDFTVSQTENETEGTSF
jgi:histone-lysine N-methyltransferase SETMAR